MGECLITRRGGSMKLYTLTISTSPGAAVTITNNKKTYTQITDGYGNAIFGKLAEGTWDIVVTKGELMEERAVYVSDNQLIDIVLNSIPDFEYSVSADDGGYKVYDRNGIDITGSPVTNGDWKIKFLKSGELKIIRLNGATDGIDVFCVGGGGGGGGATDDPQGGGGGGRTVTERDVKIEVSTYNIAIGAGGAGKTSNRGGTTIFGINSPIEVIAEGGFSGNYWNGGDGGSGGGAQIRPGGSDGGDGGTYANSIDYHAVGGKGLDETTREFHEPTGELYAGGGGGRGLNASSINHGGEGGGGRGGRWSDGTITIDDNGEHGAENTGGGGGGAAGNGGCGIVVIRNKR